MARGQRDPELERQWRERMARSLVQGSLMEGRRGLPDCIAYRNLSGERREDIRIVIDREVNPFAWTSNCRWTRQGGTAEPLASAVAPSFFFWLTLIDR